MSILIKDINKLKNIDFSKSNNFLNKFYSELSLYEIKIINSLLYIFSSYSKINKNQEITKVNFEQQFFDDNSFNFKYQDLIKIMNLNHSDITLKEFITCLENITKRRLKYSKIENDKFVISSTRFILRYEIIKPNDALEKSNIKETNISMIIDKKLYKDIFEYTKVGYTTIDININKIQSKLGLGLYEELKRITPLKQVFKKINNSYEVKDKFKQNHEYNLEELNSMFGSDYKFISHLKSKIEIQYKKIVKLGLIDDVYKFYYEKDRIYIDIVRPQYEE